MFVCLLVCLSVCCFLIFLSFLYVCLTPVDTPFNRLLLVFLLFISLSHFRSVPFYSHCLSLHIGYRPLSTRPLPARIPCWCFGRDQSLGNILFYPSNDVASVFPHFESRVNNSHVFSWLMSSPLSYILNIHARFLFHSFAAFSNCVYTSLSEETLTKYSTMND